MDLLDWPAPRGLCRSCRALVDGDRCDCAGGELVPVGEKKRLMAALYAKVGWWSLEARPFVLPPLEVTHSAEIRSGRLLAVEMRSGNTVLVRQGAVSEGFELDVRGRRVSVRAGAADAWGTNWVRKSWADDPRSMREVDRGDGRWTDLIEGPWRPLLRVVVPYGTLHVLERGPGDAIGLGPGRVESTPAGSGLREPSRARFVPDGRLRIDAG